MGKKSKRRTKTTNNSVATTDGEGATTTTRVAAPEPKAAPAPPRVPPPQELPTVPEPKPTVKSTPAPVPVTETKGPSLPAGLKANMHLLTPTQQTLAKALSSQPTNQTHLFSAWLDPNTPDSAKISLIAQLERMDKTYPSGGLVGYIENAKDLLDKSRMGVNPLEGWKPEVPQGENIVIGTTEFEKFEKIGMEELGQCGFALVAGGLGERLGYGGIKLGLPTELATETPYLQYYIETILAIQSRFAKPGMKLPLCIMVSNDTNAGTIELLESNDYFGMEKDQITIVQQGDFVPALRDNDATIAMDSKDPCKIQAKPHGHGDIHALLHSKHVAMDWCRKGLEWVIFFQDTNGLAFHTLAPALGVSVARDLVMNSIAVPRQGKQAVGGIAKLTNSAGEERTINVEYNQLDPLLRASGFPDGDVNDPTTGLSPFPGNINQLLFKLKPYAEALLRTNGAMPEFVNPKYADEAKTVFKKPTRLECMMQDFPTILTGEAAKHVGFTSFHADLCFSPVKNATADGVNLQAKGTAPGVAATGEADQYGAVRKIMTSMGCMVEDAPEATFSGIKIIPGPEIVTKPSFAVCPGEYKARFPEPSNIKISGRSSLVLSGNIIIESLDLDGALVIECEEGASGTISSLVVQNKGWEKISDESSETPEYIRIRGYNLNKVETKRIIFKKDGSVEGYSSAPVVAKSKSVAAAVTPKKGEKKELLAAVSPPLSRALAIDVKAATSKNLDLNLPRTPEATMKQAECCIVS